ncbi:MAG: tetratricopeptide repeat protein [Planctomycetota bacterium]|nr:tetratricopeptide repeat protein [Planctomycetota bacterium]
MKILLTLGVVGAIALTVVGSLLFANREQPIPDPPIPERLDSYEAALRDLIKQGQAGVLGAKDDPDRWLELGMVYMANMNEAQALACFEQSIELDPLCARCWFYAAQLRQTASDYQGAIDAMRRVTELQGGFAPASWRLGFWMLDQGEFDEAAALFQTATQLAPKDPAGFFGMAMVRMRQQRESEAAVILEDLLDWTPINRHHANLLLGGVYRRSGRIEEARRLLMGSEGPPIQWPDPWTSELSDYLRHQTWEIRFPLDLIDRGRFGQAIAILQGLLHDDPENIDLLDALAVAYQKQGQLDLSNATFRKILVLKKNQLLAQRDQESKRQAQSNLGVNFLVHKKLGMNYLLLAQQETDPDAMAEYERLGFEHVNEAIRGNPAYADARGLLAQFYERQGEFDKAIEEYQIATRDPERGVMWFNSLITRLVALERWDEAAEVLYELSYRIVPRTQTLYGLCRTLCEAGRLDEARQTADRYARLWPRDGGVMELRQLIQAAEAEPTPTESDEQ